MRNVSRLGYLWGQKDGREERALRCWSPLRLGLRAVFHRLQSPCVCVWGGGNTLLTVSEMHVGQIVGMRLEGLPPCLEAAAVGRCPVKVKGTLGITGTCSLAVPPAPGRSPLMCSLGAGFQATKRYDQRPPTRFYSPKGHAHGFTGARRSCQGEGL